MRRLPAFLVVLLWVTHSPPPANAELIGAGQISFHATAIQDITLNGGTVINPGAEIVISDVVGTGIAGLNIGDQVGDTIPIISVFGWEFVGTDTSGVVNGDFRFGNIPPFTGADYSGQITNVVQDNTDPGFATGDPSSFLSGNYSVSGDSFAFEVLTGESAGLLLTTDPAQGFSFTSTFDGLPPSAGTVITSSGDLDIYFGTELVGFSSNRRIIVTAIPEPGGVACLLLLTALVTGRRRR
ncbi:hypothetical protein [Roseiconus lacunae]|uniref:PEP-CTERM sorting domain-containing protein n=1 Tax=Roseiconus lacunae TaxID=2605694 RepID=A0ABT7PPK4_9BACT|nr:hypothetical protein [Roseiconus lacunae]MDM4018433.1 hypothetical protein [Roseiconus lacunae]